MRSLIAGSIVLFAPAAFAEPCKGTEEDVSDVCMERDIFFMPGVQGLVYAPAGASEPFFGGGVQLSPLHWSHNNDRFGPSQGAVYAQVALLGSSATDGALALWEAGLSLSFERNSSRRWMIPYFGTTIGALSHATLPSAGHTYPHAGVHFYWHHHLVFNVEGGYHFPFSHVDDLRGPRGQVSARFSMW